MVKYTTQLHMAKGSTILNVVQKVVLSIRDFLSGIVFFTQVICSQIARLTTLSLLPSF